MVRYRKHFDREIADAIQSLINAAVNRERENCALLAESMAEPAGYLARGQAIEVNRERQEICLEIADRIQRRA